MNLNIKKMTAKAIAFVMTAQIGLCISPKITGYAQTADAVISFNSDVEGFKANGPASFSWDASNDATENGGGSLKFSPKGNVKAINKKISTIADFEMGTTYDVTFKIKSDKYSEGMKAYMQLEWSNSNDTNDQYLAYATSKSPEVDLTEEWQEITFPWLSTNAAASLYVYISGFEAGDYVNIDDITFTKLETADSYLAYKGFDKNFSLNGTLLADGMNIDFSQTKTLLEVGEKEQIKMMTSDAAIGMTADQIQMKEISPSECDFASLNPAVVEVNSSGELTAKSAGTTRIVVNDTEYLNITVVDNKDDPDNFFIEEPHGQRTLITSPYDAAEKVYVLTGNAEYRNEAKLVTNIPISEPSVTSMMTWDSGIRYISGNSGDYDVGMGFYFREGMNPSKEILNGRADNAWTPKVVTYFGLTNKGPGERRRGWHQWCFVVDYPEPDSGYSYADNYMALKAYYDGKEIGSGTMYFKFSNKDNTVVFYPYKYGLMKEAYSVKAGLPFEISDVSPDLSELVNVESSIEIKLKNDIDPESVDGNIELTDKEQDIPFTYEANGNSLIIKPDYPFANDTDYQLKLKTGLRSKDALTYVGGSLKEETVFSFKTEKKALAQKNLSISGNKVTFDVINNTDEAKSAYCVAAVYNSTAARELKSTYIEIPANGRLNDVTIETDESAVGSDVELYIWDNLDSEKIVSMADPRIDEDARNISASSADADEFVTEYDVANDIVTVSGKTQTGRKGLPVIVRMYKKGNDSKFENCVRAEEITTGENGVIDYSFKLSKNDTLGRYVIAIKPAFEEQILKEIQYTTAEAITESLKRIDSASLASLPSVFEGERDTLNLTESDFDNLGSKDFVYNCIFNGKPYADKDVSVFKNIYRQALRISKIIEGDTGAAVSDIKANHNNGYWKISENKETSAFKAFTETFDNAQQANVLNKLKKSTDFDNNDTVFNAAVIAEDIKAQVTYNTMTAIFDKYLDILTLDYSKYNTLSDSKKETVLKTLSDKIDDLISVKEIEELFQKTASEKANESTSGGNNTNKPSGKGNGGSSDSKNTGDGAIMLPGITQTSKPAPDWYVPNDGNSGEKSVFSDIDGVEWAKYSITKLYNIGAISGKANGVFAPNDNMTREELCKIITAAFDFKTSENAEAVTFADVDSSAWYAEYVTICAQNGIINGIGDNLFGVGKTVTREEIATILVRAAEAAGKSLDYDFTVFPFPDDNEISDWAHESVLVLRECMIINGMEDDRFAPKENVTRAQGAKMIAGVLEFSY